MNMIRRTYSSAKLAYRAFWHFFRNDGTAAIFDLDEVVALRQKMSAAHEAASSHHEDFHLAVERKDYQAAIAAHGRTSSTCREFLETESGIGENASDMLRICADLHLAVTGVREEVMASLMCGNMVLLDLARTGELNAAQETV